jgi:hypothetical protein
MYPEHYIKNWATCQISGQRKYFQNIQHYLINVWNINEEIQEILVVCYKFSLHNAYSKSFAGFFNVLCSVTT